jgi:hypothetical protein
MRLVLLVLLLFCGMSMLHSAKAQAQLNNQYCPVAAFENAAIGPRGLATFAPFPNGAPVIYLRPELRFTPELSRSALAHECGHHAYGHPAMARQGYSLGPQQEYEADCWAARTLASLGDAQAIQAAIQDAVRTPEGSMPNRVQNIQQCAS